MNKITLGLATVGALLFVGIETSSAEAAHGSSSFGLHIGGRNLQLSVGSANAPAYPRYEQVAYRRSYSNPRWYGYGNHRTSGYRWHDTSHWDYVPGRYVPHGNHCDYVPGRQVWHRDGHWDRADRGHRGGHH